MKSISILLLVLCCAVAARAGQTQGKCVAVDASGNIYVAGDFDGVVDFDPGTGTFNLTAAPGNLDVYVTKMSAAGSLVWAKQFSGGGQEGPNSIFVDNSGNVYTTGFYTSTTDFDPGPGTYNLTFSGIMDCFIAKLDAAGNFVWAKKIGGTGADQGYSISLDNSGNVYTTGLFTGTVDFDPGAAVYNLSSAGAGDIFISKLDAAGNFIWAKGMGSTAGDYGTSIVTDASGNVYSTGSFNGTADFDPGAGTYNLTSLGSTDVYVSKLDASGNFVWAKSVGGTANDGPRGMVLDASGDIYVTGAFWGTVDFDPGAGILNLNSAGRSDIFILKLDTSGNLVWAENQGGAFFENPVAIDVDNSGSVYVAGLFDSTTDFDPGPAFYNLTPAGIIAVGNHDVFVSKLSAGGNFVWAKRLGGANADFVNGLTISDSGRVYTTGSFQGTADFDPGAPINNLVVGVSGNEDAFISKLDADGNYIWANRFGQNKKNHKELAIGTYSQDQVVVYPNPAAGFVTIEAGATASTQSYTIIDITGRVVLTGAIYSGKTLVAIGSLAPGMYYIRTGEAGQSIHRIIKQ